MTESEDLAMELEAWSRSLAGVPWSPWAPHTRILLEKAAKALRAHPQSLAGCLHPGEFGCQYYGKCLSVSCDHYGKEIRL